ncbi:hypothetical protein DOH12_02640 [Salmonella enterica subsp. enterica]|nr:hypothetical protein [Salmonella enterica subsp. enterica serovar Sandiego]EEC0251236.1 DUF927 domain-containing protein [Salmonella enterica subsp. enterica]EEE4264426.1 DUF927 domain-containing protein [Salmonella enterica subsp. enterica serovar Sandiego]
MGFKDMATKKNDMERLKTAANTAPEPVKPYFEIQGESLVYVGVKTEDSGRKSEKRVYLPPLVLCDAFTITGRGIDGNGDHYRLLTWRPRGEKHNVTYALPAATIGERDCWAGLRRRGLAVSSGRAALEKLSDYLQKEGSDVIHRITERGGWHGNAYILPSGEITGKDSDRLFYVGDTSTADAFRVSGTVEGWRDSVARLVRGNSRPCHAIGCALAAPLMGLVDMEPGGFHLFGLSSTGKSISAGAGASVWGHPGRQKLTWNATPLALTNAAIARNDGFMWIEEIGEGGAEAVSRAAYNLFNGVGKMQGAASGGNRPITRFLVLPYSTGEHALDDFLRAKDKNTDSGQKVRLPGIPADAGKGLGAFEVLNGCPDSAALAESLENATHEHYGATGRAFIEHVLADRDNAVLFIRETLSRWCADMPPGASGQAARVVKRFALTAAALELATQYGLTGWNPGEGETAIRVCLSAWLDFSQWGNDEDARIIRHFKSFIQTNLFSPRFVTLDMAQRVDYPASVNNTMGFRRLADVSGDDGEKGKRWEFWILPDAFRNEIMKDFNYRHAQKVLHDAGLIKKSTDGKFTISHRLPYMGGMIRVYVTADIGGNEE